MKTDMIELSADELDAASGGFKWQAGTKNDDVIDARGGQFNFMGFSITLDAKGNVSSITPPK